MLKNHQKEGKNLQTNLHFNEFLIEPKSVVSVERCSADFFVVSVAEGQEGTPCDKNNDNAKLN
jgi:hypothetical protein